MLQNIPPNQIWLRKVICHFTIKVIFVINSHKKVFDLWLMQAKNFQGARKVPKSQLKIHQYTVLAPS